jgi:peptide deformylase
VLTADAGEEDGLEACLSLPGIGAALPRATRATVAGFDRHGDPVAVSGHGELARCFQHETGHLRGELYIDRLDGPERAQAMRRLREQLAARR